MNVVARILRITHAHVVEVILGVMLVGSAPLCSGQLNSWTAQTSGTTINLYGVAYGSGTFVVVGTTKGGAPGTVLRSPDGVNWTHQSLSFPLDVAYGNGTFVVVGYSGGIWTSADGIGWTARSSGTANSLYGITFGNGTFVAVGDSGRILFSTYGLGWVDHTPSTGNVTLLSVAFGNGTFVAVGDAGTIRTSSDGVDWTSRTSGTGNGLRGIAYSNGTFVAVRDAGTLLTSPDGISWTSRNAGTGQNLHGVTYGSGSFVAVGGSSSSGTGGVILSSTDGINWILQNSSSGYSFFAIGTGNNIFITAGVGGVILRATVSPVTPTRVIGLSGNLAFGDFTVGAIAQRTLTISNTGNSTLTVSGISYPTGFSGVWSGSIAPGALQNVTVNFAPSAAATFGGSLTVNSDATSGASSLGVSGRGVSTCTYSLFPNGITIGAGGGTGSVTVTTGSDCAWNSSSNVGWMIIVVQIRAAGNGSVNYSVAPNPNCASRSGTLSIAGQTFTVTQDASSGSYSFSPSGRTHSISAESGSFTVTAGANCSWTATNTVSWIHTSGNGIGSGIVDYTVDANLGVARSALITVQGQAFKIDQAGNILATIGGAPVTASGNAMTFTPAMIGVNSNFSSCLWDFGDGGMSADCEPSHSFSNCGPQGVTGIVSDGITTVTNSLTVSVACAFDQLSKPVSLNMKSNFTSGKFDTAIFKAYLDLPVGFSVTNTSVSLEVAGASVPFTLNAKGQGVNGFSTIKVTHKGSATSTVWQVTGKLKGDYDAGWQNYGLTNATVTAMPITVPVLLLFDADLPESFLIDKPLLYKATAGKSGTAK